MGQPQVSHQALINEAARHKTWESLESKLMDLIVSGQVLDFKHEGSRISVTLDGTNKPVYLEVNPNAPKPSVEAVSESKSGAVAVLDRPQVSNSLKKRSDLTATAPKVSKTTPAQVGGKKVANAILAPVGVVALVGRTTESYESHVRRLAKSAFGNSKLGDEEAEAFLAGWFAGLK